MGLGNQNPHCPPGARPGCRLLPQCVFQIWAQGLGREGCVGRAAVCRPPRGALRAAAGIHGAGCLVHPQPLVKVACRAQGMTLPVANPTK